MALIIPKNNADASTLDATLKIYYDAQDWVDNETLIDKLSASLMALGIESVKKEPQSYTKKTQVLAYYGFITWEDLTDKQSRRRITDLGSKFYEARKNKDRMAVVDILIKSLSTHTFGRNVVGCASDSDVEAPNVFIKASLLLDGITNSQFAFILGQMELDHKDFADAVLQVKLEKLGVHNTTVREETQKWADPKPITALKNWGLIDSTTGSIPRDIIDKYWEQLLQLRVKNNDAVVFHSPSEDDAFEGSISPIIFYGAPGTGKTRYVQTRYYSQYPKSNRLFTTFHQSFSYEEFVEGLKPILNKDSKEVKYHIEPGVFYQACEKAAKLAGFDSLEDCISQTNEIREAKFREAIESNNTMLLCIDEINRGNIASIFGDLISLIEPSKRLGAGEYEMTVILPYSQKPFGVPANLFIVGTMNTADRSIQLLDSALRRRFRFIELGPDYSAPFKNEDSVKILKGLNARIRSILNKDNQIGHSYLLNAQNNKEILDAIINKIIPLLEEYFYNDIQKVRFVLNEDNNTQFSFYVEDEEAKAAYEAYVSKEDIDEEEKSFFVINPILNDVSEEDECGKYLEHLLV